MAEVENALRNACGFLGISEIFLILIVSEVRVAEDARNEG